MIMIASARAAASQMVNNFFVTNPHPCILSAEVEDALRLYLEGHAICRAAEVGGIQRVERLLKGVRAEAGESE